MRVAITGMGCISPLGVTVDEFSAGLLAGEVGIRRAPWLADDDPSHQLYGTVHDRFDPRQWMDDKVIAGTDGFAQMALGACAEALSQAGLEGDLDPLRTGVVGGSQMGGSHSLALAQSVYETEGRDQDVSEHGRLADLHALRPARAVIDGGNDLRHVPGRAWHCRPPRCQRR